MPMAHGVQSASLADVLERVLDKGLVIAGDIRIKLVDIELLTIQIRLVVASVDKAKEMGIDWWETEKAFSSLAPPSRPEEHNDIPVLAERLERLERAMSQSVASMDKVSQPT